MAEESGATPLIALDAVAIDTETTSLDPRQAWVVEIAGIRLVGGDVDDRGLAPTPGPAASPDTADGHPHPRHR